MRRVIICGSRHWTDPAAIARLVATLPSGTVVITGGARGVGPTHQLAQQRGLPTEVYSAARATAGRRAGPLRNARMLSTSVDAFRGPGTSPGTDHMVRMARDARVPARVFAESWPSPNCGPTSSHPA